MFKYIRSLFIVEDNYALSNMIIAVGLFAFGNFLHYNINTSFGNFISVIAWIFIFRAFKKFSFSNGSKMGGISIFIILLLLWNVFMIIYGLFEHPSESSVYEIYLQIFTSKSFFLPLLFPILTFCLKRDINFRFFFYWMAFFTILFFVLSPWALWSMTHWQFDMSLGYSGDENGENGYGAFITHSTRHITEFLPILFCLFCKRYLSSKWWNYFLLASIIGIFIQLYLARRGGVVIMLAYFLMAYYIYFRHSKSASNKLSQIFLLLLVTTFAYLVFLNFSDSAFSLILNRGVEDTRSGVEDNMIADFDKTPFDWWIGRGIWGSYYDPIFDNFRSDGVRNSIETGYLDMIIHGGYIYLGLYLCIMLYAGLKGFFSGKNILVNSLGGVILLSVLELYPWGHQTFNFKYLVIWIGVYICSQSYFCKMTDDEIFDHLFVTKKNSCNNRLTKKVFKEKNN